MRFAVLISGNGSNLQALIDASQAGRIQGELRLLGGEVISRIGGQFVEHLFAHLRRRRLPMNRTEAIYQVDQPTMLDIDHFDAGLVFCAPDEYICYQLLRRRHCRVHRTRSSNRFGRTRQNPPGGLSNPK